MNARSELVLAAREQALREQLRTQRRLIAQQVGPAAVMQSDEYPRSMTMRFLTRRPDLALQLLGWGATLLAGARLVGSARALLSAIRRR